MKTFFSLAGMILCMTSSQILLKFAGQHSVLHGGMIDGFLRNPWLWAGLGASIGGIGCWMLTLRRLPLSVAYPWTALIYVITPLASIWIFSDVLTSSYVFGMTLILAGVLFTTRGVISQ
jgi:multidrug transporter EmrE-like cation transporter